MILISDLLKIYRNFRMKLLTEKILRNWNIKFESPLTPEDRSIIREIYYHKTYSPYFPFKTKCNIVDVGAHKGFFAVYAAKNCSSDSTIICLEPARANYDQLVKNLNLNDLSPFNISRKVLGPF